MLSVPDGRSGRTLINATPIPAEGDAITSVVATMQDLVPLEEIPELSDLPVIFISAYGRDETVARALEPGAADYIVKSFSPTELVARFRAAVRRHAEPEPFVVGELAID